MNIDEASDLAMTYGVMSIPTLVIFSGGQEKERVVGLQNAEKLRAFIDGQL